MTCRLKIRLDVLADNYGKFVRALGGQTLRVAGVLKADGYGMGAVEVAHRLTREGCRIFFSAIVAGLFGIVMPLLFGRCCLLYTSPRPRD